MHVRFSLQISLLAVFLLAPLGVSAAFNDVAADSAVRPAVDYLLQRGFLEDRPQFNPNNKLNRAEAAKLIIAPVVPAEELAKLTGSSFKDVPANAWFMPYVEAARIMGVVVTADNFRPTDPVTKAEFSKMMLAARNIDYNGLFGDLKGQLAADTPLDAWFAPVMRYSVASSMTAISQDGKLNPTQQITRGQMALYVFRFEMFLQGLRTQALLSQTETDISNVLTQLEAGQPQEAEFAANRAVLAARGALAARPDENIVKASVKTAEAFKQLVMGYQAGAAGNLEETINQAKAAYASADKAQGFSPELSALADQIRQIAKQMADEARALQQQVGQQ